MWLFEIHDMTHLGCLLTHRGGKWGIPLGVEAETGLERMLPLGNSLNKLMDTDTGTKFELQRAAVHLLPVGACLVYQSEEDALAEAKALVFVDRCTDEELGCTRIEVARGATEPQWVLSCHSNGLTREAYIFSPGDGMYVYHPRDVFGTLKRFTATWTGTEFRSEPVGRSLLRHQRPESTAVEKSGVVHRLPQACPGLELTA